jgi:hypothetical protein
VCSHDTFVAWPHGPDVLHDFFTHFNILRISIHFSMGIESDDIIPFWMVWLPGMGWHWPLHFIENPHTLASTSNSKLVTLRTLEGE